MNKELYVIATPNLMRECFREFEPLFEKISKLNCYGILKNGLTLRFTGDTTGLRYFKSYSEVKEMLCEMAIRDLQQELDKYKNIVDDVYEFVEWHYKDNQEYYKNKGIGLNYPECDYVLNKLNKLKELKERNKIDE